MDLVELNSLEGNRHPWELARLEIIYNHLLKQIRNLNKPQLKILDVGSGDGYFIREICRRIPGTYAVAVDIEYSPEMLQRIKESHKPSDENVEYYKHLDEVPELDYDIVFLLDVIEHVEDVGQLFTEVKKKLTEDALFIVTVPAFQNLFCSHDVFLKHYRRYSTTLLEDHLKKSNLLVEEKGYFYFSLLLPRIFQVVKEKLFGKENKQTGIGQWNKSKGITNLITKILISDAVTCRKLGLPGLSAYAFAKSHKK